MADDDADDPFRELRLDEDFVRTATARELTAADRARRARQEADRVAEEDARLRAARRARRPHRRAATAVKRVRPRTLVWIAIAGVVIALVVNNQRGKGDDEAEVAWRSGEVTTAPVPRGAAMPTPKPSTSSTPLGRPPALPPGSGQYRFTATQSGSAAPVTYDPCRVVPVVVNTRTMPPGAEGLLDDALAEVSERTGLRLRLEGITDEPPIDSRPPFQPDRYGDRWAPVLVAWTDATESPDLDDAAGTGGSDVLEVDGVSVYVSGMVRIDGPTIADMLKADDGRAVALSVLLHELAHVVGLDHVEDRKQLMHPESYETNVFGAGDLRGLAQLGAGACLPSL